MTRRKNKTGGNGDLVYARKLNRKTADVEGRVRKKLKKRKGLKTGGRHSAVDSQDHSSPQTSRDPRLGSQKKIPLRVEPTADTNVEAASPNRPSNPVAAAEELALLENDAQLNVLLQRLEQGEKLGAGLQDYVDQKLDRMEHLMKQLGLYDETDERPDAPAETSADIDWLEQLGQAPDADDLT